MQNLEDMDVFEILIAQKLLKCPKDPFVRSLLICFGCINGIHNVSFLGELKKHPYTKTKGHEIKEFSN